MKRRPNFWGENVAESVKDIEEDEFPDFLRWMADPTGSVPGRNEDVKIRTIEPKAPSFFTDPNFKLTGTQTGSVPLFKFTYTGNDDEKSAE